MAKGIIIQLSKLRNRLHKNLKPQGINLKMSAQADHITSKFLKAIFHKFHLVHS